jgi:hypothetical protein
MQDCPLFNLHAPAPLHENPRTHSLSGLSVALMGPHTPSTPCAFLANVQAAHSPVQARSQHTPSAHCPDIQSFPLLQSCPLSSLHAPAPLQAPEGHSLWGSVFARIGPQVPFAPCPFNAAEQALHVTLHAELQQTPSTQNVLSQSLLIVQGLPLAALVFGGNAWSRSFVSICNRINAAASSTGTSSVTRPSTEDQYVSIVSDEPFFASITAKRKRSCPRSSTMVISSPFNFVFAPLTSQCH